MPKLTNSIIVSKSGVSDLHNNPTDLAIFLGRKEGFIFD